LILVLLFKYFRNADGTFQDPWLRAHEKSGGQMLNICFRSVQVEASLTRWMEWTGKNFLNDGEYILEKGLAPLVVDTHAGIGRYLEPNVWFIYKL
jgi:hypothetical protein